LQTNKLFVIFVGVVAEFLLCGLHEEQVRDCVSAEITCGRQSFGQPNTSASNRLQRSAMNSRSALTSGLIWRRSAARWSEGSIAKISSTARNSSMVSRPMFWPGWVNPGLDQ
jgi:hypothetical protein